MEHIGGVYVINLDRRTDRLEEFQEEWMSLSSLSSDSPEF